MRRKIQDLIRGEFEYDRPALLFEEEELAFSVIEAEDYSGFFRMKSSSEKPVRGIVTCENPNIRIETERFDGVSAEIRFTFLGSQVTEGDEESGCFVITSSSGEYLLPYRAKITRRYLSTSIGRIKTLNDFRNLASLSWDEAQKVFASAHFPNIFHEEAEYRTLLYQGLTQSRCGGHEMEEFLIGVGKKKRVMFSVDATELSFSVNGRPTAKSLMIKKSEWGYLHIRISCDAPFVNVAKTDFYMYDFTGKHADFSVRVIPELMHRGKNYARLVFSNSFQKETVLITAVKDGEKKEHSLLKQRRRLNARLERDHLAFRLGEMSGADWKNDMLGLLLEAEALTPDDKWLLLYQAFVFATAGEMDNANGVLASVPRSMRIARTPFGAFYQYVLALRDGDFSEEFQTRMKEIRQRYPKDPSVGWIVARTDISLQRNPVRKYQFLRQILMEESNSPLFYLEAALLLKEHPELMGSRDAFDFRMAAWLAKHDLLTRELSVRIQNLSQGHRMYSRSYLRVLSKCYKQFGDESMVRTVCVYLIHAGRYGEAYFPWFKRGVEQKLKIAGLYEAFLLSWSRAQGELPKEVVRYFSMNSSLPSGKKAMLYAYIVRNRRRLEKDWAPYMVMVKNFAVKELEKGHMSDDLAIIYEELRRKMDADEWMAIRGDADFSYKIHTMGEDVASVHVLSGARDGNVTEEKTGMPGAGRSGTRQTRVPLVGGQAFLNLYRRPFVILYEDARGSLYTTRDCCRMSKMLPGNNIYNSKPETPLTDGETRRMQNRENAERLERLEGPIDEMTELLLAFPAHADGRIPYAQQIMIRMLFTGHLGERHGELFSVLLSDSESEPLLTAYVTVFSYRLLTKNSPLPAEVYEFLGKRLRQKKQLNAWCETAFLKLYLERMRGTGSCVSGRTRQLAVESHAESVSAETYQAEAEAILRKNLFAGNYFDFYRLLSETERRKWLLMGLHVVTAYDVPGKMLYLAFPGGREAMREVLPGVYTYPLRLFAGETVSCMITDVDGNVTASVSAGGADAEMQKESEKSLPADGEESANGDIWKPSEVRKKQMTPQGGTRPDLLAALMNGNVDKKAQYAYAELCDMTEALFTPIKE